MAKTALVGCALARLRKKAAVPSAAMLIVYTSVTLAPAQAWAQSDRASPDASLRSQKANGSVERTTKYAGELVRNATGQPAVPSGSVLDRSSGFARSLAPKMSEAALQAPARPGPESAMPTASLPSGGNTIAASSISLPSGAATVGGMGESFSALETTGLATLGIPFDVPQARGAAQLSIGVGYGSSGGSGLAGIGWSLTGMVFVARKTDRGTPGYDDRDDWHPEQDRFSFGGQELVPICKVAAGTCTGALAGEAMPVWSDGWQYFRSRVETGFNRFFWSPDHRTWRVQSKNGIQFELGVPLDDSGYAGGLERNPDAPSQIYRWHIVRQYDSQGLPNASPPQPNNVVVYRYVQDGNTAYLSDIYATPPASDPLDPDLGDYAHHVGIRYDLRPDPSVSFRNGWKLEQRLRLTGVDVASKPFAGSVASPRELLRRYHLAYDPASHTSLLTSITLEGRCATPVLEQGGSLGPSDCPRMPAKLFEYQRVDAPGSGLEDSQGLAFEPLNASVLDVADSPPHSLDQTLTSLFDVNADSLPDVVVTAPAIYGGNHAVFFNQGVRDGQLSFGAPVPITISGDTGVDANVLKFDNNNVTALDLDGDVVTDLVHMPIAKKYSIFTPKRIGGEWTWFGRNIRTASGQDVKINFTQDARRTARMDVNGDGLLDVVVAAATGYQTFFALGRYPGGDGQFGNAHWTGSESAAISNEPVTACTPWSSEPVRLGDPDVQVADLNGDGLPDLVRIRSGQIHYWPGRGNGYWGTGQRDACLTGQFGQDQHVVMQNAPKFGVVTGSMQLSDVNADGLGDLIEVRADAVDVYLNENGTGWTNRQTLDAVPFKVNGTNPVRLTDINGSGSADLVWGNGFEYRYIDLTGGIRPYLLTRVHNGFGATTELEYRSSTDLMVEAAQSPQPWESVMPLSMPVVVSMTVRDNLDRVGRAAGVYRTEYSYRDPVFDGLQREFRGFRQAETRKVGDATGPSSITRSTHLLGECEVAQNGFDACSPDQRWRDNWREALKGVARTTETRDEQGVYLTTTVPHYELRQLYTGRDGRRVVVAYVTRQDTFGYDTAPFVADPTSVSLPSVDVRLAGITQNESETVVRRASLGTMRVRSSAVFDDFGNQPEATAFGCVEGCSTADEAITTHGTFERPAGEQSGWLWRQSSSYVTGSVNTSRRMERGQEHDVNGNVIRATATLSGTLPLRRFHESGAQIAPEPPDQSGGIAAPVVIETASFEIDDFGSITHSQAAGDRCRSLQLDALYAALPVRETIFGGDLGPDGCGMREFVYEATFDRGLAAVVSHLDVLEQPARFDYDGFGRVVTVTYADPDNPGQLASVPSARYQYLVPDDPSLTPYSIVVRLRQDGANRNTADYHEAYAYLDGLSRTIVALSESDPTAGDGGAFVATGRVEYNSKGAALRSFLSSFWTGDPLAFPLAAPATTRFSNQHYDAFGRTLEAFGFDGELKLRTAYHAASTDQWDAEDLRSGPHQGSFSTVRADGHGRKIETIRRVHVGGVLELRRMLVDYLPTGEPVRVVQRRAGSPDVERWSRYDSLGRMVLNVEPNTSLGFTTNTAADPDTIRAHRYAYNDAGDIVGTSDARGCGMNAFFDAAGRVIGYDFSPCLAQQEPYTEPDPSTGDGLEMFSRYDLADAETPTIVDDNGSPFVLNPDLLWGRAVSSADRAQKLVVRYDVAGRVTGTARRLAKPGASPSALADRYAPRWYVRATSYDGADRPVEMSSGATSPELMGGDGRSVTVNHYSRRGIVDRVDGSYGTLLQSRTVDEHGLLGSVVFGDAARTTRTYGFDDQQRLKSVQTYRPTAELWSSPPAGYDPPTADEPTQQLLLEDLDFEYDAANNITKITDFRMANEWAPGSKPASRRFEYDDDYRLTRVVHEYPEGDDAWTSPFHAENTSDAAPKPTPHVDFASRVLEQRFKYDHLGNTLKTQDDSNGFYDRSLGDVTQGSATSGPHQLRSASNRSITGNARAGDLSAAYDGAGNLTDLIVRREGPCLPFGADCWQRFRYDWDEVGQLVRARRWDLRTNSSERANNGSLASAVPARVADVELRYAYDGAGRRVRKTAIDPMLVQSHTLYVFGGLELRRASFSGVGSGADYTLDSATETLYVSAGAASARILHSEEDLPSPSGGRQHVFLEVASYLGSTAFIIDHATGELVEYSTYQAYGQADSSYRTGRWGNFREAYKFSGKEEDVEVGLSYFGARYLSLGLGRWVSADPATIHQFQSDPNPYAYVHGNPVTQVDPDGREPITLTAILVAVLIGAAIGAGAASAIYFGGYVARHGWDNFNSDFWEGLGVSAGLGALTGAAIGAMVVTGVPALAAGAFTGTTSLFTVAGATAVGAAALFGAGIGGGVALIFGAMLNDKPSDIADAWLRGVEAGALAGAGAALGYWAGGGYPIIGGHFTAVAFASIGGLNGAIGGWTRNYGVTGPIGFFSDSTWAIPNTAGGLIFFGLNAMSGADYNQEKSERQERHVFTNGLTDRGGTTVGHVFATGAATPDGELVDHETVHIWQQRVLGPIQPTVYFIWWGVGYLAGAGYGAAAGDDKPWARGELWAYYYNPMELMAYSMANWSTWKSNKSNQVSCAEHGTNCD